MPKFNEGQAAGLTSGSMEVSGRILPISPIAASDAGAAPPPAHAGGNRNAAPSNDPPASDQLKAAAARAAQQLEQSNRELTFVLDDKLGRMLIKIVDKQTNTVIRQVPSEDMLILARALSESRTSGLLIKGRA
jgi:flagellar protein FlaG